MAQNFIVAAVVAGTLFFAVRGVIKTLRGKGNCGCGCSNCHLNKACKGLKNNARPM